MKILRIYLKTIFFKLKILLWKIMTKTLVFEGIDVVKGLKTNELVYASIYYDKYGNKILLIKDVNGEVYEVSATDTNIGTVASVTANFFVRNRKSFLSS